MTNPFRLFFPLGIILGLAGVLPWLLFGRGIMTQAFLLAFAAGFR